MHRAYPFHCQNVFRLESLLLQCDSEMTPLFFFVFNDIVSAESHNSKNRCNVPFKTYSEMYLCIDILNFLKILTDK